MDASQHSEICVDHQARIPGPQLFASTGIADVAQPLLDDLARVNTELVHLTVDQGNQLIWVPKSQGSCRGLRYDPVVSLDG